MKVSFPENEALFGIDHDGEKRWYCWRLPHGCRGKLGRIAYADIFKPVVEIDNQFHFFGGSWRLNRRGKLRDKSMQGCRSALKEVTQQLARAKETGVPPPMRYVGGRGTVEELKAGADRLESDAFDPAPIPLYPPDQHWNGIGNRPANFLPSRIECPACGAMNRIPALQGAIKVRAGAVLPTCTDKRA
jgi:hypothetical protein